ncbi:MAG: hypothetical protein CMN32_06975 [Saprospirales bacterium]|nr:hypothetical protein [Saprospirales bacterium]
MRKSFLLLALSFVIASASGQILDPVKWKFSSNQLSDNEYELIFTAEIDEHWTVYSQDIKEDGPVPTSFYFTEGAHYERIGAVEESPENRKTIHDNVFDMEVTKFYHKAVFKQKVKVNDTSKPIEGFLEFMTCDDTRCLPPAEVEFSFSLASSGGEAQAAENKAETAQNAAPATEETETASFDQPSTESPDQESGILNPVKWDIAIAKAGEGEYDVTFKATLDKGWYIYSQILDPDGPEPTEFVFDEDENLTVEGKAKEVSDHKVAGFDEIFEMNVTKYKESVDFVQRIKVSDPAKDYTGFVYYMTCDNEKCLPPAEVNFSINPGNLIAAINVQNSGDTAAGDAVPAIGMASFTLDKSMASDCGIEIKEEKKGLWGIFGLGFIGGLLALLTPCVFPMIPLTVSFFTKSSGGKGKGIFNATMYGLFILLVYLLLSVPFHLLDSVNPDILNEISTNIWLNLAFFAIFIFFAFSFFGYYELTLPSSWANKVSAAEGVGGMVGIFFMALTLALVSFSCTGPILGSLLAGTLSSANGEGAMQLTAGMAGFGFALALPFGLFAAFPSWLNTLPKSGGWMTTVKVVLGFLELALALKFLSNADLVKHWGILKIEPFLALWILIFFAMGLYLLGKIRFPHDTPPKKLPLSRLVLALASFAFVIYLATGFSYDEKAGSLKPLKLLSGLAPPTCYSIWYPCDCPQNLNCFKDFEEGLAYAKKMNKPIMIDFTGHACVNCRKMEEHVWPTKQVYKYLRDDYVLISLYVDEKIDLPKEEQVEVPMKSGGTRKLRTTGHKWQHFQTEYFNNNSQPYYVLLSPDGKMLNKPAPYTPDENEYAAFLECGLQRFKELQESGKVLGSLE